jgi:hypothetical protein
MRTPPNTSLLDIASALGTDVLPPGGVGGGGAVSSVAGRTGAVVLTTADIGGLGTAATHAATDFDASGSAAAETARAVAAEAALSASIAIADPLANQVFC